MDEKKKDDSYFRCAMWNKESHVLSAKNIITLYSDRYCIKVAQAPLEVSCP